MTLHEYQTYLQAQDVPAETIGQQLALIEQFQRYLEELGLVDTSTSIGRTEVESFASKLIAEERNTMDNFVCLRDYADWLGNRPLYVAFIELLDCHNALDVLADTIEKQHSQELKERIFTDSLPPLGAGEADRCAYTTEISAQMESLLSTNEEREAWFQVQHGIPPEAWHESDIAEKEKYQRCGSIDEYLDLRRSERDALLTRLHDEDILWYTVDITDEVLEFVKSNPEIEVGQREGDRIYISKIPYDAANYLRETDPKMKRYYACHCPLLREAILKDLPVSEEACYCSLGHASHNLAGLDREIKGEVLESVVKGDSRCRFVFYLQ